MPFLSIRDSFSVEFVVVYMSFIGVNDDAFIRTGAVAN